MIVPYINGNLDNYNFDRFQGAEPEDRPDPVCPICGEHCVTIYKAGAEVVGCECCIDAVDAWEWSDEE